MNADEQLVVMLEARIAEFEKRMKKAERTGTRSYRDLQRGSRRATRQMEGDMMRSTSRINQALAATSTRIGVFGRTMAAGFVAGGITAAAGAVVAGTRNAARSLAAVADQAERAGVSTQAFQALKFVAEQNRIGVDALTDGLKELNIRADEFVVTGKGPAAEAFRRLGYDAEALARDLKDPEELLFTIIGRLGDLDRAGQIRVADEVFGGTAGERFVELIDEGEDGLRRTAQRAREVGAVLGDDVIEKARELDRRFSEIETRMANTFKAAVVGIADFVANYDSGINDRLDQTLAKMEAMERFGLGEVSLDAPDNLDAAAAEAEELGAAYEALRNDASDLAQALFLAAERMAGAGYADAALDVYTLGEALLSAVRGFDDGSLSADAFRAELERVTTRAGEAVGAVDGLNGLDMSGVIGQIGGVTQALAGVVARAIQAASTIAAIPGATAGAPSLAQTDVDDPRGNQFPAPPSRPSPRAPGTSARPRPAPFEVGVPDLPTGGDDPGAGNEGGGGGSRSVDNFRRTVESARAAIRDLEAEAAALMVLAETGRDVGDALDFARKKTELLAAAQEDGKAITPELEAEIDRLAEAYARAGVAAEEAAEGIGDVQSQAEAGAERMGDLFTSILDGSMSAKDAIKGLILEIAKVQLMKGFAGLAGDGGGFFGALGGLLGFASGGYTGDGPVDQVAGVVHGKEGVLNARAMRQPGVRGLMDGLNAGRPIALAAPTAAGPQRVQLDIKVTGEEGKFFRPLIEAQSRQSAVAVTETGIKAYDSELPIRSRQIERNRRRIG